MAHGSRGMLRASLIKEYMGVHQKMAQPQEQDMAGTRTLLYSTERT